MFSLTVYVFLSDRSRIKKRIYDFFNIGGSINKYWPVIWADIIIVSILVDAIILSAIKLKNW